MFLFRHWMVGVSVTRRSHQVVVCLFSLLTELVDMRAGTTHLNTSVPYFCLIGGACFRPFCSTAASYMYCTVSRLWFSAFLHSRRRVWLCLRPTLVHFSPILPLVLVVILKNYWYYLDGDIRWSNPRLPVRFWKEKIPWRHSSHLREFVTPRAQNEILMDEIFLMTCEI